MNPLDSGPGSLRDTIAAAASGDTIKFDSSVFGQTIKLTSWGLTIAQNLDIEGPVGNPIIISGNMATGVFLIESGKVVTLSGLTITKGANFADGGGGIKNQGTLTVSHCTLSDNDADGAFFGGGGISNLGTLTVNQSTLSDNHADNTPFGGGGISNLGTLTVNQSTLSDNHADFSDLGGGGIFNDDGGMVTISQSTLSGNHADGRLGGGITNLGTLTVNQSTLSGNHATLGGGIDNFGTVTLDHSTVFNNSANEGGGIFNITNATLNLNYSSVTGNTPDDVDNDGKLNQDHSTIGVLD
jgi:hypothetical protein